MNHRLNAFKSVGLCWTSRLRIRDIASWPSVSEVTSTVVRHQLLQCLAFCSPTIRFSACLNQPAENHIVFRLWSCKYRLELRIQTKNTAKVDATYYLETYLWTYRSLICVRTTADLDGSCFSRQAIPTLLPQGIKSAASITCIMHRLQYRAAQATARYDGEPGTCFAGRSGL